MNITIDEKIDFIRSIQEQSYHPALIFDDAWNIIYTNGIYDDSFFIKSGSFNFFNDFYLERNKEKIALKDCGEGEFVNEPESLFFVRSNGREVYFKIITIPLGKRGNKKIYYATMIEISSLKEKFFAMSLNSLVKASLLKDNETGNHIVRINEYCKVVSQHLQKKKNDLFAELDLDFIREISTVASMHDIGKIGVPDYILTKPGKLTKEEFDIIKEHTINGAFILAEISSEMARDIALFHHEKWDGSGYPYGLMGAEIPLCARITAIADVYDALRMPRHYKEAFSHEKSIEIINEGRDKHFQSKLIDSFNEINMTFNKIYENFTDDQKT